MATTNYNLPTITGNMNADVVRDMNALAEATDTAIKQAVGSVDLSVVEGEIADVSNDLNAHLADKTNPHEVTKSQVGLSNVDNAKQIPASEKGVAGGVAVYDAEGKVINADGSPVGESMEKISEVDFASNPNASCTISQLGNYKNLMISIKDVILSENSRISFKINGGEAITTRQVVGTTIAYNQTNPRLIYETFGMIAERAIGFVSVKEIGSQQVIEWKLTNVKNSTNEINTVYDGLAQMKDVTSIISSIELSVTSGELNGGSIEVWGVPR